MPSAWRRVLFGKPFETHHAQHTRLPNLLALPVFASDALSSVAYATEEILLVLVTIGASRGVLGLAWPVAIAIAILLAIVATSYRQTIHAYPQGGGAYRVARENLGVLPGLSAASALLIDYILTVSVSISAGVAAITSAFPALHAYSVWLAVGCILFISLANLRGAKESGALFAVPTYLFIGSIFIMLGIGLTRLALGHAMHPPEPPPGSWQAAGTGVTLFLILRAFSSGCTALTGVEAVTDGVPAFRPPESKNAAKVLAILAVILITMFVGITFLAEQLHIVPFPADMPGEHRQTVVSQLAYAVFGPTWFYYLLQGATALILILAANTAYADFPRLSMFLAQDRFFPHQFRNLGDRLVYSNGIIGVTVLSLITVIAFGASTHHLIPLYALGVFLSFTLSQAGMVARWMRLRPKGWQLYAAVNATGATATALVLVIIAVTKFMSGEPVRFFPLTTPLGLWIAVSLLFFFLLSMYHRWMGKVFIAISTLALVACWGFWHLDLFAIVGVRLGAWMVMAAIPVLIWMCLRTHAHYDEVAAHLSMEGYKGVRDFCHTVIVPVGGVHRGLMPALKYAKSIGEDVRAVYVEIDPEKTADVLARWGKFVPNVSLVVLPSPYRSMIEPLLDYIDEVERERDDDVVTVVIPEFVTEKWWTKLLHGQSGFILKWALLNRRGVVVTNIRYYLDRAPGEFAGHPLASQLEEAS